MDDTKAAEAVSCMHNPTSKQWANFLTLLIGEDILFLFGEMAQSRGNAHEDSTRLAGDFGGILTSRNHSKVERTPQGRCLGIEADALERLGSIDFGGSRARGGLRVADI